MTVARPKCRSVAVDAGVTPSFCRVVRCAVHAIAGTQIAEYLPVRQRL
jgi:hypothetical protein